MNEIIASIFIALLFMPFAVAFDETGFLRGRRLVNWNCVNDCLAVTTYSTSTCKSFCGSDDCVYNCWLDTQQEPGSSWVKCEQVCADGDAGMYESPDYDWYHGKPTAAQKRQWQRDSRRYSNNGGRTYDEEQSEHARKEDQAWNRNRPQTDPRWHSGNKGDQDFELMREERRHYRCARYDEGCNFDHHGDDHMVP